MARAEKVELPASRIGIRYAVLLSYERIWSAFGDSNSGLPHYKSGVLPTELKTQICGAQSETRTRKHWWAPVPETGVSTVPPSVHMAPDGGVDPHGLSATHGFQDRCQRRLTSSGIFVVRKARFELACLSAPGLEPNMSAASATCAWYLRRGLNPQALRQPGLNRMCIPVPPRRHIGPAQLVPWEADDQLRMTCDSW